MGVTTIEIIGVKMDGNIFNITMQNGQDGG
jgi:hypothetical protein